MAGIESHRSSQIWLRALRNCVFTQLHNTATRVEEKTGDLCFTMYSDNRFTFINGRLKKSAKFPFDPPFVQIDMKSIPLIMEANRKIICMDPKSGRVDPLMRDSSPAMHNTLEKILIVLYSMIFEAPTPTSSLKALSELKCMICN